ncbi:MAG: DinB family protein [Gemmatimonadaceae bacterium]
MDSIELLRRMWAHLSWADDLLWKALSAPRDGDAAVWREYSHIVGAEEVWLARLEQREARLPIWPEVSRAELATRRAQMVAGYSQYLNALTTATIDVPVTYRNTAGKEFSNSVADILAHVALHGQYHRGKINAMLRNSGLDPVPVDYIAWARGVPAAVTPMDAR